MKKGWKKVKLGELCEIGRGSSPRPINDQKYFEGGEIPWIKIADATKSGKFLYKTKQYVNEYGASFSRLLKKGSLIMATSGTLGYTVFLGVKGCIHDGWLYMSNFNGIEKDFLFYCLKNNTQYFYNRAYGAAIQNVNTNILRNMPIELPPLELQKRVSSILSNYDNLIENNTKRIELLEKMAKLIYDEWFVKFKFPEHENVRMVDSELGKIPEGWEVKTIGESFKVILGGTPARAKAEYWGGNVNWINSGKVNELRVINNSEGITELGLNKSATKLMPPRTTVLAITGATLGQVSLTEIEVCANQSVVGVYDESNIYSEYIFLKIKEIIKEMIMRAGGGAQQHINKEIVNQTKILLPKKGMIEDSNKFIVPIFNEISNLLFKNQTLKKTRDLLIPKLISGKVDVSDLDIKVPEVEV